MHRAKGEEGVALIEFSLVFALFVFILYALIAFGTALGLKQSITHAAAEGARAAVGIVDDPGTPDDERVTAATDDVRDSLDWIGSDKYSDSDVTATVDPCVSTPSANCITVTIAYPYKDKPIVPSAPGLGVVLPDMMTTTAVVKVD
jgi:Flp pilus assembly protein TadG